MANSELLNKAFKLPLDVLKYINGVIITHPTGDGVRRAKFLLKNGEVTYQTLKRLKNYFDYYNPQTDDKMQYNLAGGDLMRSFVERTLNANRDGVERSKEIKRDIHNNPNSELKPYQTPRLTENYNKDIEKNVVVIIVNDNYEILLLKRSDQKNSWMPNKWSLVGGHIEKNETPENACKREIKEETDLDIDNLVDSFTIQRHNDDKESVEYVFVCKYDGDPTEIKLDEENTNYGWYSVEEINYLDTVPQLMEYLTIVFKEY